MSDMTPDERDRLTRAETTIGGFDDKFKSVNDRLTSIESDLKKLLQAANMADGAWKASLKIGGLLVVFAGFIAFVVDLLMKFFGKH